MIVEPVLLMVHVVLAIVLFLLMNWIGARSYSVGYVRFSLLDDKDEALAVNYVIKVLGPIVFLVLAVAAFQYSNLSDLNSGLVRVVYFYVAIRLLLIVLYGRILVVNWFRIIVYYLSVVALADYTYSNFLLSIENLLPDFVELKNEIWLLILIFLYQVANGFEAKYPRNALQETTTAYLPELIPRKRRYIVRMFKKFDKEYSNTIDEVTEGNKEFTVFIVSIIIFENFNRPPVVRAIENLWFKTLAKGRIGTTGIMQTKSNEVLTDRESVEQGTKRLYQAYQEILRQQEGSRLYSNSIRRTIKRHCRDRVYVRQILFICKAVLDNCYREKREDFGHLYSEIQDEFSLYDAF